MNINKQNVKQLAKEYGAALRGEEVRVGDDFLQQVDSVLDAVVFYMVQAQQDKQRKTLTVTPWGEKQVADIKPIKQRNGV